MLPSVIVLYGGGQQVGRLGEEMLQWWNPHASLGDPLMRGASMCGTRWKVWRLDRINGGGWQNSALAVGQRGGWKGSRDNLQKGSQQTEIPEIVKRSGSSTPK